MWDYMRLRTVPMVAAMSIACLGLIGEGVHATFTSSTSSGQSIMVGTPDPTLSGSCVSGTNCPLDASNALYTLSTDGSTLTFTTDGSTDSSFTTGDEQVVGTNTGNLPLTDPTWTFSANVGAQLEGEAYVCATSTGIGTGDTNFLLYNGPLSAFVGTSYALDSDTLSPLGTPATATSGPTDNFTVDVYAGGESTQCGTSFTNGTGVSGGSGVAASVGSLATTGTSSAPILNGDTTGQSVAISAALTYQD
jgi:hypothetical protein